MESPNPPLPIEEDLGPGLPLGIASVHVRDLHGKFNYDVDLLPTARRRDELSGRFLAVSDERLTLLYGRNGSGKTSLLQLLFHGISASDDAGHRSALGRTRFRSFEIKLTDKSIIAYTRPDDQPPVGACVASLQRPGNKAIVWQMRTDEGGRVLRSPQQLRFVSERDLLIETPQEESDQLFLKILAQMKLNPVLLSDSRRITSDILDDDAADESESPRERRRREESARERDVLLAVQRARRYLGQVAFAGTQLGSSRVESVYLKVTEAISEQAADVEPSADILPALIERVEKIGKQAEHLNKYGLMAEFADEKLMSQLKSAPEQYARLLHQVLDPYLEGLEQRIEALKPGLTAVSAYIDALNDFLEGKKAAFHLGPEGVVITDEVTGERLSPNELSSGEKQIVLLFSNIVALQNETRLFIIDEPELSLNPEWQRHLMPRLLAITNQSRMQLLAATHSIEIMAQYRDQIHELSE